MRVTEGRMRRTPFNETHMSNNNPSYKVSLFRNFRETYPVATIDLGFAPMNSASPLRPSVKAKTRRNAGHSKHPCLALRPAGSFSNGTPINSSSIAGCCASTSMEPRTHISRTRKSSNRRYLPSQAFITQVCQQAAAAYSF